jgi:hypothetical protein
MPGMVLERYNACQVMGIAMPSNSTISIDSCSSCRHHSSAYQLLQLGQQY